MSNYVLRAALRFGPLYRFLEWFYGPEKFIARFVRTGSPIPHYHSDPEEF